MLSDVQKQVRFGMAMAGVASIALVVVSIVFLPSPIVEDEPGARLGYAIPWLLLPALSLLFGIAWLAAFRFFNKAAFDGDNPPDDRALHTGNAYLQNTVEQVLLATITYLALAICLPIDWLQLVPALAVWFLLCRILFRIGYAHGAPARAFGFAGTFYSTIAGMLLAFWFAVV